MQKNIFYCFFFLGFLVLSMTIPSLSSTNSVQNTKSSDSTFFQAGSNIQNAGYSISEDNNKNSVNLYTAAQDEQFILLSNHTIDSSGFHSSSISNSSIYSYINSSSSIISINYFISNNTKFLILGIHNSNYYYFQINALNKNESFTTGGASTPFSFSSINSFINSSDVYFSFSNKYDFYLVRYNSDNFSILFSKTINSPNTSITKNQILYYNNTLYVLIQVYQQESFPFSYTSTFYMFNKTANIGSTTFTQLQINTFTVFEKGIIFNVAYRNKPIGVYLFQNSSFRFFNFPTSSSDTAIFVPFDNQSFLCFDSSLNDLSIANFNVIDLNLSLNITYVYNIWSYSNLWLQPSTANIDNNNYYILGDYNFTQASFVISLDSTPPAIFNSPPPPYVPPNNYYSQPTTTYPVTSTTNPYSNGQSSSSTENLSIQISSSSFDIASFFVFIAIIGAIFLFVFLYRRIDANGNYRNNQNRTNNYMNRSYNTVIESNNQNSLQTSNYSRNVSNNCLSCGYQVERGDMFCQNCGKRL